MTASASLWSRRRAAVAAEEAADLAQQEEQALQEAQAGKSDAELLAELELPDPDTLKPGDDFKAFMSKAVPEHLRKRALQKLWRSNPVLACVDGLNDYDEDFLTGSTGNGPISTTYQVGKGLLAHVLKTMQPEEPEAAIPQDDMPEVDIAVAEPPQEIAEAEPEPTAAQPMPHRPRRMQFQFDGEAV